jgi:hypothetical protein
MEEPISVKAEIDPRLERNYRMAAGVRGFH